MGKFVGVLGIIVAVLGLSSCGQQTAESIAERAIERAASHSGVDVNVDVSGDTIRVADADGNTVTMGSGGLPENWPRSVVIHPNLEIEFAATMVSGGKDTWSLNGVFEGKGKELYDYYKRELSSWTNATDMVNQSGGAEMYMLEMRDSTYQFSIVVNEADGDTTVIIALTEL